MEEKKYRFCFSRKQMEKRGIDVGSTFLLGIDVYKVESLEYCGAEANMPYNVPVIVNAVPADSSERCEFWWHRKLEAYRKDCVHAFEELTATTLGAEPIPDGIILAAIRQRRTLNLLDGDEYLDGLGFSAWIFVADDYVWLITSVDEETGRIEAGYRMSATPFVARKLIHTCEEAKKGYDWAIRRYSSIITWSRKRLIFCIQKRPSVGLYCPHSFCCSFEQFLSDDHIGRAFPQLAGTANVNPFLSLLPF